jgi:DNA-binding HxlR family transcriptional regulator
MLLEGRMRYSDLKAAVPEISDRMLSERLKELEAEGIVTRIVTPDTPVRVEYELTAKGRALEEPIRALGDWASAWVSLG